MGDGDRVTTFANHTLMEDLVNDLTRNSTDVTPRREFFAQAGGAVTLGLAAITATPLRAQTPSSDWPGALNGRNRQLVDAYEANSGFPLAFVHTFLLPNDPAETSAVLVLRHGAFPFALQSAMWQKYKIGEGMKIIDPETKAPAVKNPFYKPKSGTLLKLPMKMAPVRCLPVGGFSLCAEHDRR
jgi:hypothetical protein